MAWGITCTGSVLVLRCRRGVVTEDQEPAEDGGAPTGEKKRRKRSLQDGRASVPGKRGVAYLSRIPPHMKPLKLRHLLEPFGEVLRIYAAPEDAATRLRQKRVGGNTGKNFTERYALGRVIGGTVYTAYKQLEDP